MLSKQSRSFTLIELLVVVFIIGLLASLVIVNLSSARANARDAKRISDLTTIASALQLYYADNHSYREEAGTDCEKFDNLVTTLYSPLDPTTRYLEGETAQNESTTNPQCLKYQRATATVYRLWFAPELPDKNATCLSCSIYGDIYLIKNGEVVDNW